MVDKFVKKWNEHKHELEEYIRITSQSEYNEYEKLFKLLLDFIINKDEKYGLFDNIRTLDDGDYQGTLVFIANKDTYQPSVDEYIYTSVYYGSCSGCDTLQSINDYSDETPSDEQVKEYMSLLLHMLQKTNCMQ